MIPDIDRVTRLLREAAETEILPRFRRLAAGDITEKGPGDLVTAADFASEAFLTPRLQDLMPGSVVVGEEAAQTDPASVASLAGEGPVWVVDPVDGTHNFASGLPDFAVMVGYIVGGRTRAGWIHDPLQNVTATAVEGEGAWMDGRRLRVAAPRPLAEMRGSVNRKASRRLKARMAGGRDGGLFNLRCAGKEYVALASGQAHFSLYTRLKPWDHAPGTLLHREAGGYNACLDGSPYHPTGILTGALLMAPDRETWESLRALLAEG